MVVLCVEKDYLRFVPSLFGPFYYELRPSTPSQCPTQTLLRGAPEAESCISKENA